MPVGVQHTGMIHDARNRTPYLGLGGGECDADLDLAVVRLVGEDHVVLGRVDVVRAALRAQADDVRHVDPAVQSHARENEKSHGHSWSVYSGYS